MPYIHRKATVYTLSYNVSKYIYRYKRFARSLKSYDKTIDFFSWFTYHYQPNICLRVTITNVICLWLGHRPGVYNSFHGVPTGPQVHSQFSLLNLRHAYVTVLGRLIGVVSLKEVGLLSSLYHILLVSIFITFGSFGVFSVIPYGMTLNCNLVKGKKTRS